MYCTPCLKTNSAVHKHEFTLPCAVAQLTLSRSKEVKRHSLIHLFLNEELKGTKEAYCASQYLGTHATGEGKQMIFKHPVFERTALPRTSADCEQAFAALDGLFNLISYYAAVSKRLSEVCCATVNTNCPLCILLSLLKSIFFKKNTNLFPGLLINWLSR